MAEAGLAHRRLFLVARAQSLGREPHEATGSGIEVGVERRLVLERVGIDVPASRRHQRVEYGLWQLCLTRDLGERSGDLVRPDHATGSDLLDRVAPPLQAHLGDHRFLGDEGRPGDFEIEGVKREQRFARPHRGGHRGEKPVRVAAFDKTCAGCNAHRALRFTNLQVRKTGLSFR